MSIILGSEVEFGTHLDYSKCSDDNLNFSPTWLANGGKYYNDIDHLEYCTPECSNALDLVKYEKAGERILMKRFPGMEFIKNNTDGRGATYGCHENYCIPRERFDDKFKELLMPFLVSRQIIAGSGYITKKGKVHISQRSPFIDFENIYSTTNERALIDDRDESHADRKYYRLHLIVGDSNMSEISAFLKYGTTLAFLDLFLKYPEAVPRIHLRSPVHALKEICFDPTLSRYAETVDGMKLSALDMQWIYFNSINRKFPDAGILPLWEKTLTDLQRDPHEIKYLDWPIKVDLAERYKNKIHWKKLRSIDLLYHHIDPEKSIFYQLQDKGFIQRLLTEEEINEAISNPPKDTRAWFRGNAIKRIGRKIQYIDWGEMKVWNSDLDMSDPYNNYDDLLDKIAPQLNGLSNFGSVEILR